MRLVLIAALLLSLSVEAATYKCRDAHGNWTTQACYSAPPADLGVSSYQQWLRERQPSMAARSIARTKLGPYCFRLDRLASFYDCVEGQLKIYDNLERIKGSLPSDSLPRRHLDDCLARNVDPTTGATDYRLARECYDKS